MPLNIKDPFTEKFVRELAAAAFRAGERKPKMDRSAGRE